MSSNVTSESLWNRAIAQCCQEPVHILGHIQLFGALLATDENLEQITHVSANLALMLGLTEDQGDVTSYLGQDLQRLLPEDLIHRLRSACGLPWIQTRRERVDIYNIQGKDFEVSVHFNGHRTLIEIEPLSVVLERPTTLMPRMMSLLQSLDSSEMLLAAITEELRNTTGFDRVMAYQFLQDGSGEVVAESLSNDMESFLGLRFPATDIPDLSRSLFLKTSLRVIPDIDATPVPLLAWDSDEEPLDLSLAEIRGASTFHTQHYLRGMGVQSSMTLAITNGEKLWGLFALHHTQPRLLSSEFRTALDLCGMLFSLQLQQTITTEHFYIRKQAARVLAQTFTQVKQTSNTSNKREKVLNQSWQTLVSKVLPQLCKLLEADGLSFVVDQKIFTSYGHVPPEPSILALINHQPFQEKVHSETGIVTVESFALLELSRTESLPDSVSVPVDWGESAGGGFFLLQYHANHYFVFFRNELSSEVKWAGNPDQQELIATDTRDSEFQFSPQRSFEMYQEIVRGHCRPWSRHDLAVILELKASLNHEIVMFLQQQQNLLIAELKHRVKNTLALIRSVVNQTSRSQTSLADYINVLEQRIAALGLAHELLSHSGTEWPNLEDILTIELRPYLSDEFECGKQAQLNGPKVKLSSNFIPTFILVIHELVSNAVKYGALSVPEGKVIVNWQQVNGGASIYWREVNGPRVYLPQKRGFGCELLERAIPYEFGGEATLRFLSTGVEADFWLPQDLLEWVSLNPKLQQHDSVQQVKKTVNPYLRKGASLLVEDSMLIAMELEHTLKKLGFEQVDSAPNVARALELLEQNQYRICWLDIDLKHETSFALAYELQNRQIPFAFTTGYDSKFTLPNDLKSVTLLKKPLNSAKIIDTLNRILKT
ncbi:Bacteriophytochrome (Light-regulated signal transduction histidine kinase) [Hyella patelloides LEGE 07179]|uniref:histidine kinase n=1 Tax=Hyella patelloides LEGE 07179 TaxID=945734 RepID=A0A563VNJ9_9CYAN|nr:HWE histidine kinase domain-containing protein [Hyella patelloides]VEP13040.1 Bacteriophytochrome (Light-regulated signal transduction histidine kinase) [Hyella patelloides LEGE 07179]